jgi:hypothetical protein
MEYFKLRDPQLKKKPSALLWAGRKGRSKLPPGSLSADVSCLTVNNVQKPNRKQCGSL